MFTHIRLKKTGYCFSVALLSAGWSLSALSQECPTTLAYLAPRLPRYNDANLEQMRTAVLQSNIVEAMQRARAQGATPTEAAAAALDVSVQAKDQLSTAAECVRQLSPEPEKAMAELQNGMFRFTGSQTAMEACASQYVLLYYMAVSAKETAIVAACLANKTN
jgi:hypothetical protein